MKRAVNGRVEAQVKPAEGLVHNRPDLDRPCIRRINAPLVTALRRQTDAHRPLPRFGDGDARADMIADPLPADPRIRAGEDVKAKLEPVAEAVRDFERFV